MNNNYNYTLLHDSKLYTSRFSSQSSVADALILQYVIHEYDFLELSKKNHQFIDYQNSNFDLYPLAVRYQSPDKSVYVIERPPFQIDIDFSTSKSYQYRNFPKYLTNAKMWIPWTVSIVSLRPSSMGFSNSYTFCIYFNDKPMTNFEDNLIPCFLPNSSSGVICMGQDSLAVEDMFKDKSSITEIYNYLFNSYFSGWNCDIHNDLPNVDYFYENNIIDRLLKTNKGPKNYNSLSRSNRVSTTYNQMLYLLSSLSLEEMLDYISYIKYKKNLYLPNKHTFFERLKTLSSTTLKSSNMLVNELNDPYFIVKKFSQYFSFDQFIAKVQINNFDSKYISHYSSNPYLVSQIYKKYQELKETESYSTSFSLNFDHQDLLSYFNFSSIQDSSSVISS
jgi:hypothetical protein